MSLFYRGEAARRQGSGLATGQVSNAAREAAAETETTAGPSTAPLTMKLREASLRMTDFLVSLKRTGNGRDRDNRRSFDCASRDEAARGFAQDDRFLGGFEKNRQRQQQQQRQRQPQVLRLRLSR
jgi:hypothetical protein